MFFLIKENNSQPSRMGCMVWNNRLFFGARPLVGNKLAENHQGDGMWEKLISCGPYATEPG